MKKKDIKNYTDWLVRVHTRYRISATTNCNQKCFFCHNEGGSIGNPILKPEELRCFLRTAESLKIKEIILTGGEWTISPFAKELITIMDENCPKDSMMVFSTNGRILEKFIPDLVKIRPHILRISLHAIDDNTFKSITGFSNKPTIKAIKECCLNGLNVVVNLTLCRQNGFDETLKVINFAREVGAKEVKISDLLRSNEDTRGYKNDLEKDGINPGTLIEFLGKDFKLDHIENPEDMLGSTMYIGFYKNLKIRLKMPQVGLFHGLPCLNCQTQEQCREGLYALRLTPDLKLKSCLLRGDLDEDLSEDIKNNSIQIINNKVNKILKKLWFEQHYVR